MIISHKHEFIFIHCRKVAGSSISAWLARHLGPDDLMIGSWVDAVSAGAEINARMKRELQTPKGVSILARLSRSQDSGNSVSEINRAYKKYYSDAIPGNPTFPRAEVLKDWVGDIWNEYTKFCFVRNPYDRAVSDWLWRTRKARARNVEFSEFLCRVSDAGRPDPENVVPEPPTNWPLYTVNDKVVVDFVGRFENLLLDCASIGKEIGIPFTPEVLPNAKRNMERNRDYRQYFTSQEIELAYRAYAREVDHFGYMF